jgi:hypothetical protein
VEVEYLNERSDFLVPDVLCNHSGSLTHPWPDYDGPASASMVQGYLTGISDPDPLLVCTVRPSWHRHNEPHY